MMDFFSKIVSNFSMLTIFPKKLHHNVWILNYTFGFNSFLDMLSFIPMIYIIL